MGQQFEDIEVQHMDEDNSKISFEVQKVSFERFSETKMTLEIFWNIPGSFWLDFLNFHIILTENR